MAVSGVPVFHSTFGLNSSMDFENLDPKNWVRRPDVGLMQQLQQVGTDLIVKLYFRSQVSDTSLRSQT